MHLDVVIVSYKSERWLPRCLASVYRDDFAGRCWLVDNDSLDSKLRDSLLAQYPQIAYLRSAHNLGFGGGNNLGIRQALNGGADLVGLINPDTWLEAGWFRGMLGVFRAAPDLGLAAPLQLGYENDQPAEWTRGALGIQSLDDPRLTEPLVPARWLEASALFIHRKVLEEIGGFDPLFKLYYEDNDLCRRARLAGFQLAMVPSVRYHHFGGGTLDGRGGVERGLRCDLGQALYTLTDPERSFAANVLATARLLARRLRAVLGTDHHAGPHFRALVTRLVPLVWTHRRAIRRKWKAESRQQSLTQSRKPKST